MNKKIGFIGLGFIGGNLADNFEQRGYDIVRYSKTEPFVKNINEIKRCNIVFIAVPTPTLPSGFDDSILREVIKIPSEGTIVVIKSTVPPGTVRTLQAENPRLTIIHSPEFLDADTARHDTDHPYGNILGISDLSDPIQLKSAESAMKVLPFSPNNMICTYEEATVVKYIHNVFYYMKNVFFNMAFDFVNELGADWDKIREGVLYDWRINPVHTVPVHKGGRGCGGGCHVKDMPAFIKMYETLLPEDAPGIKILKMCEKRNIKLLKESKKDLDLIQGVYGDEES